MIRSNYKHCTFRRVICDKTRSIGSLLCQLTKDISKMYPKACTG